MSAWPANRCRRRLAGRAVRLTAGRVRGVSGVFAVVRLVAAVVELVAVPSTRHLLAASVRTVALFAPRAAWVLALLPSRPRSR